MSSESGAPQPFRSLTMSRRGKGRCANEKRGIIWNRTELYSSISQAFCSIYKPLLSFFFFILYSILCVNAVPAMIASPFTQTHNKYAFYLPVKGSAAIAADDALLLEDKHVDKHRLIISPHHKNSFLSMDHQSSPSLLSLPSSSSSHLFSSLCTI